MLVGSGVQYVPASFTDEAEIEKVVQDQAELLFGSGSIFLPKTKIATGGGKGTVPDGFVIDLERECWYLVEAERASHGTWEHIAPQVSRQLAAVAQLESRGRLVQLTLKEIKASPRLRTLLPELGLEELAVHTRIEAILSQPPIVAIPIDEVPPDLLDWANSLKNQVKVWRIEKFVRDDTGEVLYKIPDDTAPTVETKAPGMGVSTTQFQGGNWFQRVYAAGLLKSGDRLHMEYGPKGRKKETFEAVVRPDGLEVDGRVYSPSYAAVHCMRKAGSDRRTANGWTIWRTAAGMLINDLAEKLGEP